MGTRRASVARAALVAVVLMAAVAARTMSGTKDGPAMTTVRAQSPAPEPVPATESAVVMKGRAPVSDALVRVRLPAPATFDLANGLRVFVLEDRRAAQVSFTLVIPGAGGYFDPPDAPGLATFTAAMMREGTTTRASDDIARTLEILSASLDLTAGAASPDATISGVCLTEHFETVIDLLADVLLHPSFADQELSRYKARVRASFLEQRTNPNFLSNELFARLVNGNHPAARTSPTPEALESVTAQALSAFHKSHYVPDRAAMVIAGDVSGTEARRLLIARLGSWPHAGRAVALLTDPPSRPAGGIHLVTRPHSVQTRLMVGTAAIARTHPDYYALLVMNQVIGAGPTGRLFVHLREQKGYTYAAFSVLAAGPYRGSWSASTDVRTEVTGPALTDLLGEIARLRDQPVPEEELRRQQRAMIASFALTLESPKQVLGYTLSQWTYRLPADYWDRYPSRIMAVSSADVQRVARTYLAPAALHIVAVGDPLRIKEGLAAFGPVETYGPDGRKLP